jgi:hypothetical protein
MITQHVSQVEGRRRRQWRTLVTSLLLVLLAVLIVRDILVRRWSAERPLPSGVTRRSV